MSEMTRKNEEVRKDSYDSGSSDTGAISSAGDVCANPQDGGTMDMDEMDMDIDDMDKGAENDWEETYACPLDIRFTQEKIHPFFYRRGPIVNVVSKIRRVAHVNGIKDPVVELVPPFTPIHCLRKGPYLWSLDNRRLYALQLSAMEQWPQPCRVRVLCRDRLPRHQIKSQYRKFNTTTEGRTIDVCTRYQQFDTWKWFDRAVELEWSELSQLLGVLLTIFQALPLFGALLFRTGVTGFASRAPFIVGIILSFAIDFVRQHVPRFERGVCKLHVRALMETGPAPTGPRFAAIMALVFVLVLPYILSITHSRLRWSLFSCWLAAACMSAAELGVAHRTFGDVPPAEGALQLSPKHRVDGSPKQRDRPPRRGDASPERRYSEEPERRDPEESVGG